MSAYGRNHYPRRYGGGKRAFAHEHIALLDALTDLYDTTEGTSVWVDMYAFSVAIGIVWALNKRVTNQAIPARMLEALTDWEEACSLRPSPSDSVIQRRKRVAARLRGMAGNDLTNLNEACTALGGNNFVRLLSVPVANQINYWPGVYPGPPGYEYSSNRLVVCAEMTRGTLADVVYRRLQQQMEALLDSMLPAYMRYVVGVNEGGFTLGVGVLGETLL